MRVLFCAIGAALWIHALSPAVTRAVDANPEGHRLVHAALQAELDGSPAQRQRLLAEALEADPDYAPARWHSGHVLEAEGWLTVEEAAERSRANASLAGYRRLRDALPPSAPGHLQLARYCRAHDLKDQERLHWTYLLAFVPDSPEALRALGLRKYKNQYLTADQIEEKEAAEAAHEKLAKHWQAKCSQLRHDLASADTEIRQRALAELRSLRDPQAIAWMDTELADADQDAQLAIVDFLGEMEEQVATLALVRRAVMGSGPEVREAAAQQLRQRPIHSYAPVLMSCIATPVELRYFVHTLQDGVAAQYSLFREGPEADYLWELSDVFCRSNTTYFKRRRAVSIQVLALDQRIRLANATLMNLRQLSAAVQDANERASQWNERIFAALCIATECENEPTPTAWWDWWRKYNELAEYDKKPLITHTDERYDVRHTFKVVPSCFMPGTIVWTETGPAPIESVRIGDRVLAQDLETGELAYKLVLGTTIRPPSEIVRVRTENHEVHATLGHPFWVIGEGWRMTKQLVPGDRLYGLSGTVAIDAVEPGPQWRAHNLVVEGFNTYFVGEHQLLVHDNTLRVPTKALVPGLLGESLR
jgi:hypothetical protein